MTAVIRPHLLLALTVSLSSAQAQAQDCQTRDELSTCVASDNLWTHVGGGRWMSLAPTQTTPEASVSFGLTPGFIYRPIGLRVASPDPEGTTISAIEAAFGATFHAGLGVTDDFQFHIAAPVTLYQDGAGKSDIIGSDDTPPRSAIGDMRFGVTWSLVTRAPRTGGPGLSARFEVAAPTGQNDAYTGYESTTYAPGASFDWRLGDFALGIDTSFRIRREVILATNKLGPQVTISAGAGYDIVDDGWLSVGVETFVFITTSSQFDLQQSNQSLDAKLVEGPVHAPMEWMVTTRTAGMLDGRFRIALGGGSFIPTSDDFAVTTPAFRIASSFQYRFERLAGD